MFGSDEFLVELYFGYIGNDAFAILMLVYLFLLSKFFFLMI